MCEKNHKNGEFQDNGIMYDSMLDVNHDGKVTFLEEFEMTREIERFNSIWNGSDAGGDDI